MKGWRTLAANAGAITGALLVLLSVRGHDAEAITGGVVALANIILRMYTSTPVGEAAPVKGDSSCQKLS